MANFRHKNNLCFLALLICMLGCFATVTAQTPRKVTVSGRVIDLNGAPLLGVAVTTMGQIPAGTTTDRNGHFSFQALADQIVQFSFLGFQPKEMAASKLNNATVTLDESTQAVDEIVVIGYGSIKKSDLTGSVSSVKSTELLSGSPVNVAQGLQGKMAGVQVSQTDGAPGASVGILIRGANSFSTSSEPLYILDGVPYEGSMSTINPNDIESVEVLKDASATAIYGSRGANGVVIISTKRNKGSERIEFSTSLGISQLNRTLRVLDGVDYAYKQNEAYANQGLYYGGDGWIPFPEGGKWSYKDEENHKFGTYLPDPKDFRNPRVVTDEYGNSSRINNTDWVKQITQLGFTQQYDLSVSGGSDKGYHAFSFGYLDQQGTLIGTGYKRYTGRINLTRKLYRWLEVGVSASGSRDFTNIARDQIASGPSGGLIRSALIYPTNRSIEDVDELETMAYLSYNPASYLKNQKNEENKLWLNTSSFIQIQLAKNLKFRQNIGYFYSQAHNDAYYSRYTWAGSATNNINGLGRRRSTPSEGTTFESVLTFDKQFGKLHKLNVVGGFTYEKRKWGYTEMEAQNFSDDDTAYFNMDKATQKNYMRSDQTANTLVSFLARANYTLADKYLFTVTFRSDGSSKFAEGNKFANFFSGAVAWKASEEKFIKNLNVFHELKVRASYGQTGNQGVSPYETIQRLSPANAWINGGLVNGIELGGPVDKNLKWETTSQYDLGVDMSFLKGRLGFVVDLYHKTTEDLLQRLTIPFSTGYKSIRTNFGTVTNKGIELTANIIPVSTKDWVWRLAFNASLNQNRISGLRGDQYAQQIWSQLPTAIIQRNGYPIGTLYGYVVDGFYNNIAEVKADPQYANLSDIAAKQYVGEYRYRDLNHDGKITEKDDMTVIGDVNPTMVYGINSSLTFRNWTLNIFLQGTHGNDILNGNTTDVRMDNASNIPEFMYANRWTPEQGDAAQWPKLQNQIRSIPFSNRYVEDGSYLRLKNISLGYDFKNPFKSKVVKNINLTFSAQNLFTITNYSWFDPDVSVFGNDIARRGVDMYAYPSSRIYTFSLKLTF